MSVKPIVRIAARARKRKALTGPHPRPPLGECRGASPFSACGEPHESPPLGRFRLSF